MIWDDLFYAMLKGIADEYGFDFTKTRAGYVLSKMEGISVGFMTFVDRDRKLKITMSKSLSRMPIDLGNYTQDELKGKNSKARRAIIVKLMNS